MSAAGAGPAAVVHYVDADTFGGVEQVMLMLMSSLSRARWRPILYCHAESAPDQLVRGAIDAGVECRRVSAPKSLRDWRALRAFRRQLLDDRPKIFHAHLNWPLGCRLGLLAARLASVPKIVATSHLLHPIDQVRLPKLKQALQSAAIDAYVAVSEDVARGLGAELHVAKHKTRVVHNGIHIPCRVPDTNMSLRSSLLQGNKDQPIILTPARLHTQKGHDYLLQAAVQVPQALFVFAGDGPQREQLQARARELGVAKRVLFLGHRDDVDELLAACDLFVLPSINEGLPLSVLEAMAASKPVVATAVGGVSEAVVDDVSGVLVPPRDSEALARAIRRLIGEPSLARRLAIEGRQRVSKGFSVRSMASGIEAVYEELLAFRLRPSV